MSSPSIGYEDTPLLPGGQWHVHDARRPQPTVVTPGTVSTPDAPGRPPSDAVILFDGSDLSAWRTASGEPAGWLVENGYMQVPPRGTTGGGDIWTREEFGDCQLHVEWATPNPPSGSSQGRGNSGIFLFGRYEIQVLDSYENPTYADGNAGAIYGQYPPLVNASREPGAWQTYDIVFTAPRFEGDHVAAPAYLTLIHNGVVLHAHTALMGGTTHKRSPQYAAHGGWGPLKLQDHGDPVRYRNLWVRRLKSYDEP